MCVQIVKFVTISLVNIRNCSLIVISFKFVKFPRCICSIFGIYLFHMSTSCSKFNTSDQPLSVILIESQNIYFNILNTKKSKL